MPTFVIQYRIPAEVQETTVDADDREHAIDSLVLQQNPDVEVEIVDCREQDPEETEQPPEPAPIEAPATTA